MRNRRQEPMLIQLLQFAYMMGGMAGSLAIANHLAEGQTLLALVIFPFVAGGAMFGINIFAALLYKVINVLPPQA